MATTIKTRRITTDPPQGGGRRGLLISIAALVAVLVAGFLLFAPNDKDPGDGNRGDKHPQSSPAPLPPGLKVGEASVSADLATTTVAGVPRGFPQTVPGAVESAVSALNFYQFAGAEQPTATRDALTIELGLAPATSVFRDLATKFQTKYGLDAEGRPVDAAPGLRFYNECLPEYGMYSAEAVSPTPAKPEKVRVSIWAPCIQGMGSPTQIDNLRIDWVVTRTAWAWLDDGWRIDLSVNRATDWPDDPSLERKPKDMLRPNVSLAEREQLWGDMPGWTLFRGYSEAWPAKLLGEEPK